MSGDAGVQKVSRVRLGVNAYSTPLLHRCIPDMAINLGTDVITAIFGTLNHADWLKVTLADFVTLWREMLVLCFGALGECILCHHV
jgi:hypothetical protein